MSSDGYIFFRRALWFWQEMRANRFPNAVSLSNKEEISTDAATKVIARLQNEHLSSMEYDHAKKGFFLQNPDETLPFLPVSHQEILALAIARHHLKQTNTGVLGGQLETYWERLLPSLRDKVPDELLDDALYSVEDTRRAPAEDKILYAILSALLANQRLRVRYCSPHRNEITEREISPWHLRFVDGRLYLWAFCHQREGVRLFHVVGFEDARLSQAKATPRPEDFAQRYLSGGLGSFHSQRPFSVVIRVDPPQSRYIAAEQWHPEQQDRWFGAVLERSFLAEHAGEVALRLLGLGQSVTVCSPPHLREEIARQARIIAERHARSVT